MSSFNESVGLGYLKTNAIEFVKYPLSICQISQLHWIFLENRTAIKKKKKDAKVGKMYINNTFKLSLQDVCKL